MCLFSSKDNFNPTKDLLDLKDKVVIVTGAKWEAFRYRRVIVSDISAEESDMPLFCTLHGQVQKYILQHAMKWLPWAQ